MTYSPEHVADEQRITQLLETLDRDLIELRKMLAICDEAQTMPGRGISSRDVEGSGHQAPAGPPRPTETIALDGARQRLIAAQMSGAAYIIHAMACVRGATAGLDRALTYWEGEDPVVISGGVHEDANGAAGYPGIAG